MAKNQNLQIKKHKLILIIKNFKMIRTMKCKLHLMMINHKMIRMHKKNNLFNPTIIKIKVVNLIIVQMILKIQIITNLTTNRITVKVMVKKIVLKILKIKNLMEITHRIKTIKIKTQIIRRVRVKVKVARRNHFYLNQVIELLMKIQIYNIFKMIKKTNKKKVFKISPFLKMKSMILFIIINLIMI